MPEIVGVVFTPGGPVHRYDPAGHELHWNQRVICETSRGREYGRVVQANYEVDAEILSAPLRRVVRPATPEDEQLRRRQRELADQAVALFKQLVRERSLRVKTFSG